MNKRDANRLAKKIFMSYGWQADADWSEAEEYYELNDDDSALVYAYYQRCADRVHDFLNL